MAINNLEGYLNKYKNGNLDLNLKVNFNNACKDQLFRAYANTITLSDERLSAYTSKLEIAFKEKSNCINCKSLSNCKNELRGYCYTAYVNEKDSLTFTYESCPYMLEEIQKEEVAKNMSLFDMPRDIRNSKLIDIDIKDKNRTAAIKWISKFIDDYHDNNHIKGLYLHGSFGSGKTYLIAALFNELTKQGLKSAIVYWPEFLRSLKSSFNTNYEEKFNYIKRVPLLLIDDIGAESVSAWGRDEILSSILQFRMQEEMSTFFTSNMSMTDLEEHLSITKAKNDRLKSRRIMERIKQVSTEMEIVSKNRRN